MPPVIVGHAFDVAQPDGQHGLSAFQRLNLALLVHAQHYRVFRGMQIQAHDVAHFLHEKRIGREFEVPLTMRLQPERPPDAVHRGFRKPRLACNLPHTPVRAAFRFRLQRLAHQLRYPFVADRPGTARTQLVMQSRYALFHKAPPPFAHGGVAQSQLPGNLLVHLSRRAQQNNARPSHQSRRKRAGTGHAFQLRPLLPT
jgi:hypothetical protein